MVMVIDGEDEDNMMEAMEDPSIIIDPRATSVDEGINSKRETMQLRLSRYFNITTVMIDCIDDMR